MTGELLLRVKEANTRIETHLEAVRSASLLVLDPNTLRPPNFHELTELLHHDCRRGLGPRNFLEFNEIRPATERAYSRNP